MDEPMATSADAPEATSAEARRGRTMIAHEVLLTIARLSALQTPGVARTSPAPDGVDRLFKRGIEDGVRVEVHDQTVLVDLYLVLQPGFGLREVGRAVQTAVRRAMEEMVGMDVLAVNVHVEDISDPEKETQ